MKKNIFLIPLIVLCLSESVTFSQQEGWSELNLGHNLTSSNKYAVGGTCLIFAENTSRNVYAFSSSTGKWSSRTVRTLLEWKEAYSGGNTAVIFNDSLAVFYSALNDSLVLLKFEGQILSINGKKSVGVKENYGYLVTNIKAYVFDAKDSQIRNSTYTGVGTDSPGGGINEYSDYFCMSIWNTSPMAHTLVAYSSVTKTIAEFKYGSAYSSWTSLEFLDHGFVMRPTAGPVYLYGGYSAYTGTFVTKLSDLIPVTGILPGYDPVSVQPRLCYLFVTRSEIDPQGIAIWYLWVFNTLTGAFDQFSYNYHYNNSHLVPDFAATGGQFALHTTYDKDNSDKVNMVIYNAYTQTFSQHDFSLAYDYRNYYYVGGHTILIYSKNKFVFYDVLKDLTLEHVSDWQSGEFPVGESIKLGNDYAVLVYRDPANQEKTLVSFNGTTGKKKVSFHPLQGSLAATIASVNYALLLLLNTSYPDSNLIYSQVKDEWITKQLAPGIGYDYKNTYCLHSNNNDKTTTIFDAKTGTETLIAGYPSAQIIRDSIFAFNGSDQKIYGYSSFINSVVSQPLNYYSNIYSDRIVFYYNRYPAASPDHLLYDANLGKFVTLSLDNQIHGSGIHIAAGMKTALRVSGKGYLFAYNPKEVGNGGVPVVTTFATPNNGQVPLNVQFNAQVTGGNAPLVFGWDFGDGSTSTLQNPTHSFLLPGTYTAEVTVTDADGEKGKNSVVIAVNVSTGIEEMTISRLGVYPVPANDFITLQLNSIIPSNDYVLKIHSLTGAIVTEKIIDVLETNQTFVVPIDNLPSGIYVITLSGGRQVFKSKFIRLE